MSKVPGAKLLGEKSLDFLKENVILGNVCECLILADLHKDERLKSVAQAFFIKNSDDISATDEWKELEKKNVYLAKETTCLLWEAKFLQCLKKVRMSKEPGVKGIRKKDLDFLKENVNLRNVCECLILGDLLKDEHLKSVAQAFFMENSDDIRDSEEWKELERENIGLAAETMCLLSEKMRLQCLNQLRMSKVPGAKVLGDKSLDFLRGNVNLGNVCECLILSDLHNDEHLKSVALAFFLENWDDIRNSEEWKELKGENSALAAETMFLLSEAKFMQCLGKARKSQVPSVELLGERSLDFLKEHVSLGNVCECLILADLHNDKHLKSVAQAFFIKNSDDIRASEEWKELERENIGLAAKTMSLLCEIKFLQCLKELRMSKEPGVEGIRKKDLDFLKENVNLRNVCECLILGDLLKDEHLKSVAQAFFMENSDDISVSEEWKELERENIGLAAETMCLLSEKMRLQCLNQLRMSKVVPGAKELGDKYLDFLRENVNLGNVCECLILADLHNDKHLKSVAQAFFIKNSDDIRASEEWKELERENIGLAAETMSLLCEAKFLQCLKELRMSKEPGVEGIRKKDLDFLKENVNLRSVCECLILADLLKDEHLKSVAQAFFMENSDDIRDSEEWKELERENIDLAAETKRLLCLKK